MATVGLNSMLKRAKGRLDRTSQDRPPLSKSSLAKLFAATVVKPQIRTGGVFGVT